MEGGGSSLLLSPPQSFAGRPSAPLRREDGPEIFMMLEIHLLVLSRVRRFESLRVKGKSAAIKKGAAGKCDQFCYSGEYFSWAGSARSTPGKLGVICIVDGLSFKFCHILLAV